MLNHDDLIHMASLLGYKGNEEGLCRGYSAMWMQAVCAGSTALETFQRRLAFLEKFCEKLRSPVPLNAREQVSPPEGPITEQMERDRLDQAIQAAWKKAKIQGVKALTETEKNLYELRAFFDGIHLYQNPEQSELPPKVLRQTDTPELSAYILSQALEKKGGLRRELMSLDFYRTETLTKYLTLIADTLREQADVALLLGANEHQVAARVLPDGTFQLMDTNHLEDANNTFSAGRLARRLRNSTFNRNEKTNAPLGLHTEIYTAGDKHLKATCLQALSPSKEKVSALLQDELGMTLLHYAALYKGAVDITRFDFTKIPINAVDQPNGNTALHYAAASNNLQMMKILIDKGADVNVKNAAGKSPLNHAARANNPEAIKLLITHGAFDHAALKGCEPALQQACLKKALESYINGHETLTDPSLDHSKKQKIDAAKALLDHMEGKAVDLGQHQVTLNQGRLKRIYEQQHKLKDAIQQYNQPTAPEVKPDDGESEHL